MPTAAAGKVWPGAVRGSETVLLVGETAAHPEAIEALLRAGLRVRRCARYREALQIIDRCAITIVFCHEHLSDGTWRDILARLSPVPTSPPLVVLTDALDSSLWAEAIGAGAFDVLLTPVLEPEVRRVCRTVPQRRTA
jgi:DNA-binding NtrC family response regulator